MRLKPVRGECRKLAEEHEVLITDEVAAFLRVSTKTAFAHAREGTLPGGKVEGAWRFLRRDVSALVRGGSATKLMSESGGIVAPRRRPR
ncbi:helix-turn-helix domain-containing protein [Brevibacterium paucivorans]|uniref:helix-turn-helix domain-containing protein n=1 Tax=Brevibacterium paucivorans TaxID=170994 RepID=UPI00215567D5|nr:helix-turn-helix domain-containing protein [Brevibacterium paucivorans]